MTSIAVTVDALIEAVAQASAAYGAGLAVKRIGAGDRTVHSVAPLDQATAEQLSFLANPRYRNAVAGSAAGVLVLTEADCNAVFEGEGRLPPAAKTIVVCDQPYAWFAFAAQVLAPARRAQPGRAAQAIVATSARVAADVCVEPFAVIEADAVVEQGAWIGAGAYVGQGVKVGAQTRLYPGAKVQDGCVLGARVILHSGAVIGADGFGFAPYAGQYIKIPQTGRVLVGNDVEIGANTTIDRGTMGDTVIEDGVKIDNQVQIGHNCRIGAHTVIAGCAGIAGSTTIGKGCQLGGASMVLGHLNICAGTVISAATLVTHNVHEPAFFTGFFPFMKNRDWEKNAATLRHLSELRDRVRKLERQLKTENS